jgi:hypothetical protein
MITQRPNRGFILKTVDGPIAVKEASLGFSGREA